MGDYLSKSYKYQSNEFVNFCNMDGWKNVVPEADQIKVFGRLEDIINQLVQILVGLQVTIPILNIEAKRT